LLGLSASSAGFLCGLRLLAGGLLWSVCLFRVSCSSCKNE